MRPKRIFIFRYLDCVRNNFIIIFLQIAVSLLVGALFTQFMPDSYEIRGDVTMATHLEPNLGVFVSTIKGHQIKDQVSLLLNEYKSSKLISEFRISAEENTIYFWIRGWSVKDLEDIRFKVAQQIVEIQNAKLAEEESSILMRYNKTMMLLFDPYGLKAGYDTVYQKFWLLQGMGKKASFLKNSIPVRKINNSLLAGISAAGVCFLLLTLFISHCSWPYFKQ